MNSHKILSRGITIAVNLRVYFGCKLNINYKRHKVLLLKQIKFCFYELVEFHENWLIAEQVFL